MSGLADASELPDLRQAAARQVLVGHSRGEAETLESNVESARRKVAID